MNKIKEIISWCIAGAFVLMAFVGLGILGNYSSEKARQSAMNETQELFDMVREDDQKTLDLDNYIRYINDSDYKEFIIEQINDMCENDEDVLLCKILEYFDNKGVNYIQATVKNGLEKMSGEKAFAVIVFNDTNLGNGYGDSQMSDLITRDSKIFNAIIEENGINPITRIPGQGYYSDRTDECTIRRHGIEGSALYDAEETTYEGDFAIIHSYGVRLDSYYQERGYSNYSYMFRDRNISSSPDEGDYVWTGDKLFHFDDEGELLEFVEVNDN